MNQFAPLAFLDPFDLISSLPRRMGLFKIGSDDPEDHRKMLFIRTQRGVDEYRNVGDLGKWPELKAIVSQIERVGEQQGGVEFGRIFLELLPAGVCLPWQSEDTPYFARFNRTIMRLRVNPGAALYYGVETLQPPPGLIVMVNQRTPHCQINIGETSAISLVIDFRRLAGSAV
jgi:hypothetical protein